MKSNIELRKHKVIFQATLFGLLFGFLLQKGGVAKYHILVGQLLITDFTEMKVMLSAIFVAMIGLYFLKITAKIKMHIKTTKYASNVIGGLIFGIGFACSGYCPGTGAAGLGQGDIPAGIFMFGLVAGSYLYAECSNFLKRTIDKLGDKGKLTLHTVLRINTGPSIVISASTILGIIFVIMIVEKN